MKLFHHYKNKPYTFKAIARHSETLEEMVVYETRYENDNGKLWVRPKGMFFETVTINNKETPRFKEISLEIQEFTKISDTEIAILAKIIEKAFGQWDPKWFHSEFKNHNNFCLLIAYAENQPVGFKLGYEENSHDFYSWLGGVLPDFRGLEIAADLMKHQHEWCKKQGYARIKTRTQNRFREMLILNLKHGFEVIGFHDSDEGGPKIVLEKNLG
jgi:GNAT superfamily N-acetyltransferase